MRKQLDDESAAWARGQRLRHRLAAVDSMSLAELRGWYGEHDVTGAMAELVCRRIEELAARERATIRLGNELDRELGVTA